MPSAVLRLCLVFALFQFPIQVLDSLIAISPENDQISAPGGGGGGGEWVKGGVKATTLSKTSTQEI